MHRALSIQIIFSVMRFPLSKVGRTGGTALASETQHIRLLSKVQNWCSHHQSNTSRSFCLHSRRGWPRCLLRGFLKEAVGRTDGRRVACSVRVRPSIPIKTSEFSLSPPPPAEVDRTPFTPRREKSERSSWKTNINWGTPVRNVILCRLNCYKGHNRKAYSEFSSQLSV